MWAISLAIGSGLALLAGTMAEFDVYGDRTINVLILFVVITNLVHNILKKEESER